MWAAVAASSMSRSQVSSDLVRIGLFAGSSSRLTCSIREGNQSSDVSGGRTGAWMDESNPLWAATRKSFCVGESPSELHLFLVRSTVFQPLSDSEGWEEEEGRG